MSKIGKRGNRIIVTEKEIEYPAEQFKCVSLVMFLISNLREIANLDDNQYQSVKEGIIAIMDGKSEEFIESRKDEMIANFMAEFGIRRLEKE